MKKVFQSLRKRVKMQVRQKILRSQVSQTLIYIPASLRYRRLSSIIINLTHTFKKVSKTPTTLFKEQFHQICSRFSKTAPSCSHSRQDNYTSSSCPSSVQSMCTDLSISFVNISSSRVEARKCSLMRRTI